MKPFVLVVDDSLTVRMDLRHALSSKNFAVTACGTLTTARQVLKSRGCDLAVLDLMLPDGNGSDLLREMKSDPELCHIPVIVVSLAAEEATEGAEACFGKPYDSARIVRLAEELCTANLGGRRFLIVDDSPTFACALGEHLRKQGNEVVVAETGEEALALLQKERFDCVILDMVMPGIGGIETCRRLRQQGHADLPVVMLTANENVSGRSQGVAMGADEFLLKSSRVDMMSAKIHALLRRLQAPRARAASGLRR